MALDDLTLSSSVKYPPILDCNSRSILPACRQSAAKLDVSELYLAACLQAVTVTYSSADADDCDGNSK